MSIQAKQIKPINRKKKTKKALSTIIAYVLLVTFAVVIGVLVYKWMKSYVPQEDLNCPDESSLFIKSDTYDCTTHQLTLEILNNGKFDIGGYFIYATDSPYKTLATIDLTKNETDAGSRMDPYGVKFGSPTSENSLGPGKTETDVFDTTGIPRIYSIEIIPLRWQVNNREKNLVSCKDVVIKENISCYAACVADPIGTTCLGIQCGTKMNNCREVVDCGRCSGTDVCNSTGQCVIPADCIDTCASLGWECNSVCGEDCGSCTAPKTCDTNNHCSCVVSSYIPALNTFCGSKSVTDNCGGVSTQTGTLTCTPPQSCGGGGTPNVCGCTVSSYIPALNTFCGSKSVTDNCGGVSTQTGTLTCTPPQTCNATNMCSCIPETNPQFCARLNKDCGSVTANDNCGNSRTANCGSCTLPKTCNSSNMCSSIGNGVCDPGETCADEPVACQGHQATCPAGQICVSGACQPINGGGVGCTNYCISLLHVPPYTSSTCVGAAGQCGSKFGGTLQPGGNIYCGGALLCCCIP